MVENQNPLAKEAGAEVRTPVKETALVEGITKRLAELEHEVNTLKAQSKATEEYNLLIQGLNRGSRGVWGAFILIPLIYVINSLLFLYTNGQKEFMAPAYVLGLAGIMAITLLAYFGLIFGYSTKVVASWKDKNLGLTLAKLEKENKALRSELGR